jgi:hypothetical protein
MTIIEKLTKDVLNDEYFKLIFSKCSLISAKYNLKIELSDNILTNKELTDALRFSDILSNSKSSEARNKAYQIITY